MKTKTKKKKKMSLKVLLFLAKKYWEEHKYDYLKERW